MEVYSDVRSTCLPEDEDDEDTAPVVGCGLLLLLLPDGLGAAAADPAAELFHRVHLFPL